MYLSIMDTLDLVCDRSLLLAAIQAAEAVAPSSTTKPILTNLLIDAKPAHVEIIATDSQVGLRCLLRRVEVRHAGQVVIGARQIAAILKESESATVDLRLDTQGERSSLHLGLADGEYDLPVVVGEAFPPVSFFPAEATPISVSGARLDEMLRQTIFAMDKDKTSAVLSGLLMSISPGELTLVATDGKVLCEAVENDPTRIEAKLAEPVQAVLPAPAVGHLHRLIANAKPARIEIAFSGKLVFVRLAVEGGLQIELTSRLVEGVFPSYKSALTTKSSSSVGFTVAELASAVRRSALMTNQTSRGIVLGLDTDSAVFSNLNSNLGSVRITMRCEYQGSPVRLGLNAQYLSDILRVFQNGKITIEIGRGLVMRDVGATYLIMPIVLPN